MINILIFRSLDEKNSAVQATRDCVSIPISIAGNSNNDLNVSTANPGTSEEVLQSRSFDSALKN